MMVMMMMMNTKFHFFHFLRMNATMHADMLLVFYVHGCSAGRWNCPYFYTFDVVLLTPKSIMVCVTFYIVLMQIYDDECCTSVWNL
jgi:hypothetical protein